MKAISRSKQTRDHASRSNRSGWRGSRLRTPGMVEILTPAHSATGTDWPRDWPTVWMSLSFRIPPSVQIATCPVNGRTSNRSNDGLSHRHAGGPNPPRVGTRTGRDPPCLPRSCRRSVVESSPPRLFGQPESSEPGKDPKKAQSILRAQKEVSPLRTLLEAACILYAVCVYIYIYTVYIQYTLGPEPPCTF